MICYRDMTFCKAKCSEADCSRNWGLLDKSGYEKWSEAFGGNGPVALADFSSDCPNYKEKS